MATLRKGHSYTKVKRAYTRRSKFKRKGFIKAVPPSKVIRYDMGDLKKKFPMKLELKVKKDIQLRHNALESARQVVNRSLSKKLGPLGYHLKIMVYPHHILRENKMITGAGADRMQTGMQRAFGRSIGLAAQVKKNQTVFTAYINEKDKQVAFDALKSATRRLPCKCSIV